MGLLSVVSKMFSGPLELFELSSEVTSGEALAAVRPVLARLWHAPYMEVRAKTSSEDFLEAVLGREHLSQCEAELAGLFGEPVKPFGVRMQFSDALTKLIDSRGGIRKEQCLYLKRYEGGKIAFAALWPWSGGQKVTLKLGVYEESLTA